MIQQRLLAKLQKITTGSYQSTDFIIADAKDGDMAFGIPAPGPVTDKISERRFKSRAEYLQNMTLMVQSGLIDILLMSASSAENLTEAGLFKTSDVTPAIRFNDTTDIWSARGSSYRDHPSHPFESVDQSELSNLCNLGLYSVTFYNDLESDLRSLKQYREFRRQARENQLHHFLEVFNPAYDIGLSQTPQKTELGDYINDMILKTLAGVTKKDSPLFLKMQFNGHRAMQDLAAYDPENLVVGILGGAAGTTRDTFELAKQAEQAGARVALFGRKINLAEAPLELVRLMRSVIEESTNSEQAVKDYHRYLEAHQITPQRSLSDDLQVTDPVLQS